MVARKQVTAWISRSIPVLLVAFLWAGLWKMWPEIRPYSWHPQAKPFRIKLVEIEKPLKPVEDPSIFAFSSEISYRPEDGPSVELLQIPDMPQGRNEFLPISGQVLKARARDTASRYSVWRRSRDVFEDIWSEEDVLGAAGIGTQLVVQVSEELREAGFLPEEIIAGELKSFPPGWEMQLFLDIDKYGIPSHVLIEKSSGNKDIDKLLYRKVLQGKAGRREVRGGRVKISYGFE